MSMGFLRTSLVSVSEFLRHRLCGKRVSEGKGFWKRDGRWELPLFAGKWGIGPGNVLATPREKVREVRDLVRTDRGQVRVGMVREVRYFVRTGRGQAKAGMVRGEMVKVLGTKVHVSTASKYDIRQQSA